MAAEAAAELTASPVICARTPRRMRRVAMHLGRSMVTMILGGSTMNFSHPLLLRHLDALLMVTRRVTGDRRGVSR